MKIVTLTFGITDDMNLRSVSIDRNKTGLHNDSKLIQAIAWAVLKGICNNKEDVELQDICNDLGISKSGKE